MPPSTVFNTSFADYVIVMNGGHSITSLSICSGQSDDIPLTSSSRVEHATARLEGGSKESEGRVLVYYNGQWVNVCNDTWDMDDATVVCRQLGYGRVLSIEVGSLNRTFVRGQPTQTWMHNVQCRNTESSLLQCDSNFSVWNEAESRHFSEAEVSCCKTMLI